MDTHPPSPVLPTRHDRVVFTHFMDLTGTPQERRERLGELYREAIRKAYEEGDK